VNVHSKIAIADDECIVIGSANLNNRSMVLDTECCIALVAAGEPRIRTAIAGLRDRLLAEHLDTTPAEVAAALAHDERPNTVLDWLRDKPGRTLRTLEPVVTPQLDALVPVSARLDPEQPIEPDRFVREFVPREQHRVLTARFFVLGAAVLLVAALALAWRFSPLGKELNIPTFIDAAADTPPVSHLWDYANMGYDLCAFSGGKAMRGPQCAGLLIGKKELVANALLNNSPHEDTLGRVAKVGKEEIMGMIKALELYLKEDHEALNKEWQRRLEYARDSLSCRLRR